MSRGGKRERPPPDPAPEAWRTALATSFPFGDPTSAHRVARCRALLRAVLVTREALEIEARRIVNGWPHAYVEAQISLLLNLTENQDP